MTLTDEVAPGIHRTRIPTPFAVGDVNCYVLRGDPLTLVDTGPNSGTSLDHLERSMRELGLAVEDLDLVVLTHHHMDHEGLLDIVLRRSGAKLAAFHALTPWLADYRRSAVDDDLFSQALMRNHGIDDDVVSVVGVLAAALHAYGSAAEVDIALHDGDSLRMGGRDFTVHHRPGHSTSDLVFLDQSDGVLLAGDHLLPHISSNALVTRPLGAAVDAPRPQSLLDYARSLRATSDLPAKLILPGHGDLLTDHTVLVDSRLRDQARRARNIRKLLTSGPLTAHQVAVEMWGRVALTQAYLTLSEVLGHLDMLLADGTVDETVTPAGVTVFQAH